MKVAVIGGGVTGLSAAWELEKARRSGMELACTVYEAETRMGGVLRSEVIDGSVVELGPDSFISEKPWAAELARELGLGDALVGSNDAARKTWLLTDGRLVELPDGLMFMVPTKLWPTVTTPLFPWTSKLRMARELLMRPRALEGDESVSAFVERHFGPVMTERLVDPLLSGVYGGQADKLSVRAVLPRFVEMQERSGSLCRGMLASRKKMQERRRQATGSLFTTLAHGMQSLVEEIEEQLPASWLRSDSPVDELRCERDGWHVESCGEDERYDAVILALPAHVASELLWNTAHDLAEALDEINYSSSLTLTFGYRSEQLQRLPEGFGFLIPRREGLRMLAGTFVHRKFDGRAPEGRGLVRCFFGGSTDEDFLALSDEKIVALALDELRRVTGLGERPQFARLQRWRHAMAQYAPGHLDLLERIEQLREEFTGLELAGNAYRGIGVPDCVRSGREAARRALLTAETGRPVV